MADCHEGAILLLEDDSGRIAMQFRDDILRWRLFGGWSEAGESPIETAIRELSEELSIVLPEKRFMPKGIYEVRPGVFGHVFRVAVSDDLKNAVLREGLAWC